MKIKYVKVWRLETATGRGAYAANTANDAHEYGKCTLNCWGSSRHPTPSQDLLLRHKWSELYHHEWYFGFATIAQYKAWFYTKKARQILASGYKDLSPPVKLVLYKVPARNYHRGMTQVIFKRTNRVKKILERSPDI